MDHGSIILRNRITWWESALLHFKSPGKICCSCKFEPNGNTAQTPLLGWLHYATVRTSLSIDMTSFIKIQFPSCTGCPFLKAISQVVLILQEKKYIPLQAARTINTKEKKNKP